MSAFTAGPWIAEKWWRGWFVTAPGDYPNAGNRRTMAELDENKLPTLVRHQCEANARLIAAAPEMYAALQTAVQFAHHDATCACGPEPDRSCPVGAVRILLAKIDA